MNKKVVVSIVGIALVSLIVGAFLLRSDAPTGSAGTANTNLGHAPEVSIQDENGVNITLQEALERPTVINSWASWCPFCVDELPEFAEFAERHEGVIDLFAVNRGESIEKGSVFLQELGLAESVMRVFYDPAEALYRGFGGFSMPETIFVDADGTIRFHKRGPLSLEDLETISNDLGWK